MATNEYYEATPAISRHKLARAEAIRAELEAIQRGFDRLPQRAQFNEGRLSHLGAAGGTANAYTADMPGTPTGYVEGMSFTLQAPAPNTGAATLDLNGLGQRAIRRVDGGALVAGDIGAMFGVIYDGSKFLLITPSSIDVTRTAASAAEAAASATAAAGSKTGAATSAGQAATSATASATSAAQAASSASGAATSKTGADTAKSGADSAKAGAETARTGAQTAQTAAETARTGSETARNASQTAQAAAEAARNKAQDWADKGENQTVETGKYSAKHHALKAAASAAAAATSFDTFDDRYLGAKAADPTLDNDGNALLEGAMFWHTGEKASKLWSGTEWRRIDAAATFPNVNGAVNASHTEMNYLVGVSSAIQTQLNNKLGASAKAVDSARLEGRTPGQFLYSDTDDTMQGTLTLVRATPALQLRDTADDTASRMLLADGYLYVQAGAVGAGATTSGGKVRISGYNGANLTSLEARFGNTWAKIWHSGNDGDGSDLDADKLDGKHATDFLLAGGTAVNASKLSGLALADVRSQNRVLDARISGDVPGSTGAADYMPTPGDAIFGKNVVTLFSQDWPGTSWGSMLTVSGWDQNYVSWQLAGSADSVITTQDLYHRVGDGSTWQAWRKIWTDGNDGPGSGMNADLVDGYHAAKDSYGINQIAVRNSAGDLHCRLVRSNYATGTITTSAAILMRNNDSADNYHRPVTPASFVAWLNANNSGLNADTLDGIEGWQFLRSNEDDFMDGSLTLSGKIAIGSGQFGYHSNSASFGLNMANGDIVGVNAMYFNDKSDTGSEGILWPRNSGAGLSYYSSLYAKDDTLYFAGDATSTPDTVNHSGLSAGSIGQYVFAKLTTGSKTHGQTTSGANLMPAAESDGQRTDTGQTLSGTWRCLGHSPSSNWQTLWVRIS